MGVEKWGAITEASAMFSPAASRSAGDDWWLTCQRGSPPVARPDKQALIQWQLLRKVPGETWGGACLLGRHAALFRTATIQSLFLPWGQGTVGTNWPFSDGFSVSVMRPPPRFHKRIGKRAVFEREGRRIFKLKSKQSLALKDKSTGF